MIYSLVREVNPVNVLQKTVRLKERNFTTNLF